MENKKELKDYIDEIKPDFEKVLAYSQNYYDETKINSQPIFSIWAMNKSKFFHYFGDKLILEGPVVTLPLSEETQEKKYKEFKFSFEESPYGNSFPLFVEFLDICSYKDFFQNSLSKNYPIPNTDKTIPAGCKFVKAFKYFLNDSLLRIWQDKASTIIQENTVTGQLCLSIHPLDFLSLSENASNWRSCHSLDGEHRSGNLSYMLDASTFIAYIKSTQPDEKISRFPYSVPWNNKKWRNLLFLSDTDEMIFAGRPYPFSCDNALNAIKDLLFSLPNMYCIFPRGVAGVKWTKGQVISCHLDSDSEEAIGITLEDTERRLTQDLKLSQGRLIYSRGEFVPIRYLIDEKQDSKWLHYNDLLWSCSYFPYHLLSPYASMSQQHFSIGCDVPCLLCGDNIGSGETFLCNTCEHKADVNEDVYAYCRYCDQELSEEEAYYIDGANEYLCENCYNNFTNSCARCGTRHFNFNLFYDKKSADIYCTVCWELLNKKTNNDPEDKTVSTN